VSYPWGDASRAVAGRFDFVSRAGEIAARDPQPAILLVTGAEDDPAFPLQAQRLKSELRRRYRDPQRVSLMSIPGMKHAFAAEPGVAPTPQTPEAKLVDAAVTDWFGRYLRYPARSTTACSPGETTPGKGPDDIAGDLFDQRRRVFRFGRGASG
jgi:hypothetical protein